MISQSTNPAFAFWFCGLPGSGKTTIARGVHEKILQSNGEDSHQRNIALVEMDSIRKKIFPHPSYSDEERDVAYRAFVLLGSTLSQKSIAVLLDAVGHKRIWRDMARQECPKFVEVYVRCPIEICIQRETERTGSGDGIRQNLYKDALLRLKTGKKIEGLGKVPGVDEPFEESPHPEVILDSANEKPEALIEEAIKALSRFDPQLFYIGK